MLKKRWGSLLTGLLISSACHSKTVRVLVIDTGFDLTYERSVKLCPSGHYDFVHNKKGLGTDDYPTRHGSAVSLMIAQILKDKDYCIVVYKVFDSSGYAKVDVVARAIKYSVNRDIHYINLSVANVDASDDNLTYMEMMERDAIKEASDNNIKIFIAAGNRGLNLTDKCTQYPACYANIKNKFVVGALTKKNKIAPYSNYGKIVDMWEYGCIDTPMYLCGTSLATPRALANYVSKHE